MKDNFDNINNDLLVKYLLGETNPDEALVVKNWLDEDESNRKLFGQLKIIWEQSRQQYAPGTINEEAAWQRFRNRIHPVNNSLLRMRRVYHWPFLRVAVILITVIVAAWLIFYFSNNRPVTNKSVYSQNSSITDTLPDGSIVTLNRHSLLGYPGAFNGVNRSVQLQGEAFFNISPDKSKPFIVYVNDIRIKVVGTSFNVKSTRSSTEVIVESGVVEVTRKNNAVVLNPREKIFINKSDTSLVKLPVTDKLYNYYRTREFICDNTPLWKLVEVLNQAFDSNIIIERKELKSLPLTTVFNNKPLDSILVVIRETFNLTVMKSGDSIVLK